MLGARRVVVTGLPLVVAGVAIALAILRPTVVLTHRVDRGDVRVEALGSGALESRQVVDLGFDVTGRIGRIDVDQGDKIEADQVLAVLDDQTFKADAATAEEDVRLAEAGLERLRADLHRAEVVMPAAGAHFERVRDLYATKVAAREALDDAEERLELAKADLARAKAAELEGERRLAVAHRTVEQAQATLDRTIARSPFDGLVLRREREVGDVAVPGAAVLRLAATDTLWASVWVDETFVSGLRPGLSARILFRSRQDAPLSGHVVRIGREVDRETRELLVDVAIDVLPDRYALGQRVDLWIELAKAADVVRIPPEFVVHAGSKSGAFVLGQDGRASFRELRVGLAGQEWVEVLDGLEPGVLEARPARPGTALSDGQRIRAIQEPAP